MCSRPNDAGDCHIRHCSQTGFGRWGKRDTTDQLGLDNGSSLVQMILFLPENSPFAFDSQLLISPSLGDPCLLISMDHQISWLEHGPLCRETYMFRL